MSLRDPEVQAWNVSENQFPQKGPKTEQLKFLLKYAILAPSSHNTQPWLFKIVNDNIIELYADRTRALAVVDPDDRELIISCGAALSHLQIAIRHFGYAYRVKLFLEPNNKDLLAQVTIGEGKKEPIKEENSLFEAITKRRTNRLQFEDRELSALLIPKLQSIVTEQGQLGGGEEIRRRRIRTWLYIAKEEDKKNSLADLIAEGDRIQMSDKRLRRELASWIHSNRSHSKDGMPGYAFGYNDIISYMGPFVIRTFDTGKGQAAKDRQLAVGSPVLAVLGTESDEPMDWLQAGMALSKMLLLARSENVWSSFLDQPIEVPELRFKVQQLLKEEKGFPQIILRMGYYGQNIKPTPRRQVDEVLHR
jgi:Putative TM nitroreductase